MCLAPWGSLECGGRQERSIVAPALSSCRPGLRPACSDVVLGARLSAVTLLSEQIEKLMFELSVWRASPELMVR